MEALREFYEDVRRRDSEEVGFGSRWLSTADPGFEFSVFWVAATQELCVLRSPVRDVASDGPVSRFILGIPPHTNPRELRDDEVVVEVLARLTKAEVDARLAGWETHNRELGGLDWLRRAVTSPGARAPK